MARIGAGDTGSVGGDSGGDGGGSNSNQSRQRQRRRETIIGDDGSGGGGGSDTTSSGGGGTGPGGQRNIRDIQQGAQQPAQDTDQQPTIESGTPTGQQMREATGGGGREPSARLQPAEPVDTETIRAVQEFGQRRANERAEAFRQQQRELGQDRFRDVQEFAQRRTKERAGRLQEARDRQVRQFNRQNFRDVQEFAQRRAEARGPEVERIVLDETLIDGGPVDIDAGETVTISERGFAKGAFADNPLGQDIGALDEFASDPVESITGAPGGLESAAGDVAFQIRDLSRGAENFLNVNVVDPAAGVAGDIGEAVATEPLIDPDETDISPEEVDPALRDASAPLSGVIETDQDPIERFAVTGDVAGQSPEAAGARVERFVGGFGRGLTGLTAGLPATAVEVGNVGAEAGEFTASAIEEEGVVPGLETSIVAGGTVAGATAVDIAEQSAENPFQTAGLISGGAAGSVATTPVRLASTRVPTAGGGTTAIRGVRLREPLVFRPLTGRLRGRTVVGARGFRPSFGAPSIRGVDTDLARMGGTGTAAIEPGSAFEADIIRATASDIGGEAATRFRTTEALQRQATRRPAGATGFEFETAEEAIGQARAVPGSAVEDVTQTLRDIDATVFGSAAARAQVSEFRQPRDIDIVVSDKGEATRLLGQALEGEEATVSDVFDIKAEADVPGRARGGEEIKFGFQSMEPRDLGGVRFNPVEEEAIRKAGASAFLREPGTAGTPDFDIGPEPRRPGRTDVREKDVTDTVMIARQLGLSESAIGGFERAFGLADTPEGTGGLFGALPTTDDVPTFSSEFARDIRGQATIGAGGRIDVDPLARQLEDIGVDTRRTRVDTESPTGGTRAVESPAPVSRGFTSPSPAAGAGGVSSPFGVGGDTETVGPSPGPTQQQDASPIPGFGVPDVPSPGGEPSDGGTPGGFDIPNIPSPFTPPPPPPNTPGVNVPPPPPSPFPDPQPGGSPETVVRLEGNQRDTDEEEFQPILPTGQEFENPIASGAQFLFGGGGRDGNGGGADDPMSLFIE